MRIIHNIQHGGEKGGGIDVWREGRGDMFVCGDGGEEGIMNFQSPTEKAGASQNLYPHNYDHHQTLATTNGERTQDITRRWGWRWGGGVNRDTLCCTNVIHFNP